MGNKTIWGLSLKYLGQFSIGQQNKKINNELKSNVKILLSNKLKKMSKFELINSKKKLMKKKDNFQNIVVFQDQGKEQENIKREKVEGFIHSIIDSLKKRERREGTIGRKKRRKENPIGGCTVDQALIVPK